MISGVRYNRTRPERTCRPMVEFHSVMVGIQSSDDVPAGIIPVDDVVVVPPGVPTNLEIEIKAAAKREDSLQVLRADAVERLRPVQYEVGIIRLRSAVLDPAAIFKPSAFTILAQQIGGSAGRVDR